MKNTYLPKAQNDFVFSVLGSKTEIALTALAIIAVCAIILFVKKSRK